MNKSSNIRDMILDNIDMHPSDITTFIAENFSISRQAAHRHVAKLVKEGILQTEGTTRSRLYRLKQVVDFSKVLEITDIEEDKVWREYIKPLVKDLPSNIRNICQYGFTEMVNNVIDHSSGSSLTIALSYTIKKLQMIVKDNGIGVFNKIYKECDLDDPLHAILELSKGKLTTDPKRHTGEGIFFTSRMFDVFVIQSGHLSFAHLDDDDFLLEHRDKFVEGTAIVMSIALDSKRKMQKVFDAYSSAEGGFKKTIVPVSLAAYGEENLLSRSQAKRLLKRFDVFEEIVLNFAGVELVGQAFIDEIFRVFQEEHPDIRLHTIKENAQIKKMIKHVKKSNE